MTKKLLNIKESAYPGRHRKILKLMDRVKAITEKFYPSKGKNTPKRKKVPGFDRAFGK